MAPPKVEVLESLHGSTVTVADMLDAVQTTKVSLLSLRGNVHQKSRQDQATCREFWAG